MSDSKRRRLAQALRRRRLELGYSATHVAERAGIDITTYTRMEAGTTGNPSGENLARIAQVLRLPVSDLFASLNWLPNTDLPSVRPYLRTKYRELPETAIAEIEAFTQRLRREYGGSGPENGEDEK